MDTAHLHYRWRQMVLR